jgi:hypothetical protein
MRRSCDKIILSCQDKTRETPLCSEKRSGLPAEIRQLHGTLFVEQ